MLPQDKCTGCLACMIVCNNRCISAITDKNGFLYPRIDKERCSHCQCCETVCPVLKKKKGENHFKVDAFGGYSLDYKVREESSSGGIFTVLADYVLHKNGIVYGAAFDDKLFVSHIAVKKSEDLYKLRGSKYMQSDISACYKDVKNYLQDGRIVLFTGTPCQIEGLNSYLGREYINLILVDIICHGVPSQRVWENYLIWQEKKHQSKPIVANFRDKCSGWEKFSLSLGFENGTTYRKKLDEDCYMKAFLQNYCLRDSCYQCDFKTVNRVSDLTIGDLWGINKIAPELNDNVGVSVVFVQSEKGQYILKDVKSHMLLKPIDCESAIGYNIAMVRSMYRQPMRDYFYYMLGKKDFEELVEEVFKPTLMTRIKKKLLQLFKK